ncbi:hypothetical protein GCM10027161_00660 [Microbispora hainanensis]
MRSLSCVLIREGPSDDWFLPILLRRALEDLVIESFPACREVQEVRSLPKAGNQSLSRCSEPWIGNGERSTWSFITMTELHRPSRVLCWNACGRLGRRVTSRSRWWPLCR